MLNPQELSEFMEFLQVYRAFQQFKTIKQEFSGAQDAPAKELTSAEQSTPIIQNSEVVDLQKQIADLTQQLAAAQEKLRQATAQNNVLQKQNEELSTNISSWEFMTGKDFNAEIAKLKEGKKSLPRKGKEAHDAYAKIMEAADNADELRLYDSDSVFDVGERVADTGETYEEALERLLAKSERTTNAALKYGSKPIEQGPSNTQF